MHHHHMFFCDSMDVVVGYRTVLKRGVMGCRQSRARYCRLQDRIDVLVSLAVQVIASLNHRGKLVTHASEAVSPGSQMGG